MTAFPVRRAVLFGWIALGLLLRTPGLAFNGIADLDDYVFVWGSQVHQFGLGDGFGWHYGLFSYVVFGQAAAAAAWIPRFWWLPYKLAVLASEAGVLCLLLRLVPAPGRLAVVLAFWVNPLFVLMGTWYGFWDPAYICFGLLGLLVLSRNRGGEGVWFPVGALFMAAAVLKPQGVAYFVLPGLIYLSARAIRHASLPLVLYLGGIGSTLAVGAILLLATGGSPFGLIWNFLSVGAAMPNLTNNAMNLWWPAARFLQAVTGQTGPLYELRLPSPLDTAIPLLINAGVLLLIGLVAVFAAARTRDSPVPRSGRRLAGGAAVALALAGLLRRSDAGAHPHLFLGRYTGEFLLFLAGLLAVGLLLLIPPPSAARALDRIARAARGALEKLAGSDGGLRPFDALFLTIAFASLAIPQLGANAHSNHVYAALVLLIPLACRHRRLWYGWAAVAGTHLYYFLSHYHLGRPAIWPQRFRVDSFMLEPVLPVAVSPAGRLADPLIRWQQEAANVLERFLPLEPAATLLCLAQAAMVLGILRILWKAMRVPAPISQPPSPNPIYLNHG